MDKIKKALDRQIQLLSRRSAKTDSVAELCTLSSTMIDLIRTARNETPTVSEAPESRDAETQN